MLIDLLEVKDFRMRFDFLYVPIDFDKCAGLGYAFVNFVTHDDATRAMHVLENFDDWKVPSQKVLRLSWSLPLQGLVANVERYRNSAVMHPDIPQRFKPMVFENGCLVAFPAPTRHIALGVLSRFAETCAKGGAPQVQPRTREEQPQQKARNMQPRPPVTCPDVQASEYSTVMLRNLPNNYTRDMLVRLLETKGFRSRFDFVYYPIDFSRASGLGYAFVNFVTHNDAHHAMEVFANFDDWEVPSVKVLQLSWSMPLQGLAANIERYRNNAIMHPDVPEHFKPLVFKNGHPVPFPFPTRNIHPPHRRRK
jgi:RNA recognition motif-containing protein